MNEDDANEEAAREGAPLSEAGGCGYSGQVISCDTLAVVNEEDKPKTVKFKVDEESDSDGLFSDDDDMSYSSSDSDSSELDVTGGYYTKEMFLKKCVLLCYH